MYNEDVMYNEDRKVMEQLNFINSSGNYIRFIITKLSAQVAYKWLYKCHITVSNNKLHLTRARTLFYRLIYQSHPVVRL